MEHLGIIPGFNNRVPYTIAYATHGHPSRFRLLSSQKPKALRIGQQGIFPQRPLKSGNNGDKKRQGNLSGIPKLCFCLMCFFCFLVVVLIYHDLIFDDLKKIY